MAQDSFEFRRAIWSVLNEGLLNDVYSNVPQDADFPYVAIGGIMALNADTKTSDALEYDVTIHFWEKDVESSQIVEILFAEVQDLLNDRESNLLPSGYKVVISRLTSQSVIPLSYESGAAGSDKYVHGMQRYTMVVYDAS
jgi:hypothetical protein